MVVALKRAFEQSLKAARLHTHLPADTAHAGIFVRTIKGCTFVVIPSSACLVLDPVRTFIQIYCRFLQSA